MERLKTTIRTSDFMDIVKLNAILAVGDESLATLEDRLKLVPSGDYLSPVNILVAVDTAAGDIPLINQLQSTANRAYRANEGRFEIIPDSAPRRIGRMLPEDEGLSAVRNIIQNRYGVVSGPTEGIFRKDTGKQVDFYARHDIRLEPQRAAVSSEARIMAQRLYAEFLKGYGIRAEMPRAPVRPITRFTNYS